MIILLTSGKQYFSIGTILKLPLTGKKRTNIKVDSAQENTKNFSSFFKLRSWLFYHQKKIHFYKGLWVDFHWNIDFSACQTMKWMCAVKIQDLTNEIQDVTHLCYK